MASPSESEDIIMTDVLAYGAGADDAAVEETALLTKLDQARHQLAAPFASERIELVASVADALLGAKRSTASGPAAHFAFWTRRAALTKLAASFAARVPQNALARPRGLVFHLPPQNVETVFLYSWALAYLAGNANIVRLPQGISARMRAIVDLFLERLEAAGDESQLFVHYPSQGDLGAKISALSDARVVWGGDAKVALFAPLPLRNGGKSIWFGDRFSFSTINGEALDRLDDDALRALAKKLHNDVFVFDQMACSSPHALYVVGEAGAHSAAVKRLLDASALAWTMDDPAGWIGHAIGKMTAAFYAAANGRASSVNWRNTNLTSIIASAPQRQDLRVGGGFLSVVFVRSLAEIASFIGESDQTITYFGWDRGEIEAVAASRTGPGVSRWAPIGTALDFDFIWDGYDIPFELTRLVRVS
jgi:Acyl-CoA reductase (LuxC)